MCKQCFLNERAQFQDSKEWLAFDLELTRKLASKTLVNIKSIRKDREMYIELYKCMKCNQLWKLKEPNENFGQGWFLFESTKAKNTRVSYSFILLLTLIIMITLWWKIFTSLDFFTN